MAKLNTKLTQFAEKYYKTSDLSTLSPYQLDKLITWSLNHNPDQGRSAQKKYIKAKGKTTKELRHNTLSRKQKFNLG